MPKSKPALKSNSAHTQERTMASHHDVIIIGAGLSGLSCAHFLRKKHPELNFIILESASRPGGAVQSLKDQGFLAEWGPHGFLDNNEASQELLRDLGLDTISHKAPLGKFVRYVCHKGKLEQLPQSPQKLLRTPLLSALGKLRLLGDLFIKPLENDQTIGDWTGRRFGREVLPLVDAAVTGTFAGDFSRLSIDAVMPGARQLEKEAGSLLRGLIKKKKASPSQAATSLPAMTSFPEGMEQLIHVLAEKQPIQYETEARHVAKEGNTWTITTNKDSYTTCKLIIALPVNGALKILAPFSPPFPEIPTASIVTVVLGFDSSANIPMGFGYLAPERENRFALGALFSTRMFPGRAPNGKVLLEALVGGRRHPERLALPDDELIINVYEDLRQLMDLPHPPCYSRVLRSTHSIPQLEMNHPRLLAWLENLTKKVTGLGVCGFGWKGIGMNDMMKDARLASETIFENVPGQEERLPVKPVYF